MKKLGGFIAEFDQAAVLENDLTDVASVHSELVELTKKYDRLNHVETLVGGYDDDPRSLYEIVEVRAWMQSIHQQWPDWLFWLTPASLRTCVLSLNPGMHRRNADGQLQIEMDLEKVIEQVQASHVAAAEVLLDAGVSSNTIASFAEEAVDMVTDMAESKQLGDYVLLHPDTGDVLIRRRAE